MNYQMNNQYQTTTAPQSLWKERVDTRSQFITKVYIHLFAAIMAFVGVETILFTTGLAEPIAKALLSISWFVPLGLFMVVSWIASRTAASAKSLPAQYLALAAYVVGEAIIFVPLLYIAAYYIEEPNVIANAAVVTMLGFGVLTLIVFITRKDFSFLRTVITWGGICALALIAVSIFTGMSLGPIFSIAMIALAGGAILYDTSNILHRYPDDRFVAASLQLFGSVALMFWYVLMLFMNRR